MSIGSSIKSAVSKGVSTVTSGTTDTTTKDTTGNVATYATDGITENNLNITMQLFGIPYQFLPSVDQRVPGVSNKIGRKFVDNIITDSAIVTIIPGEPRYLPGVSDKSAYTNALISAANGSFSELKNLTSNSTEDLRLYDFQSAYIKYYQYVNILCRSCAGYLELDKDTGYQINGEPVPNFLNYDWKNYRWNGRNYSSIARNVVQSGWNSVLSAIMTAGSSLVKGVGKNSTTIDMTQSDVLNKSNDDLDSTENVLRSMNYIQFYCESDDSRGGESLSNNTQQSAFKQMLDSGSSAMKDVAFLANSGGIDTTSLSQLGEAANTEMEKLLGSDGTVNTNVGSIVSRLLSAGKSVIKGENFMMPDIYGSSDNSKSYSINLKFKAMYGNRLSLYTDVIVPLMHIIALAYPRATTANTYTSPPLVKVYQKGAWTCNLGIISGIEITKNDVPESWNVDGLSTEVSVSISIADLYSDMALTPGNNPILFANNSSLVEYLGTTCGLDLVDPQLTTKVSNIWNNAVSLVQDIPKTAMGTVTESFDRVISAFNGL